MVDRDCVHLTALTAVKPPSHHHCDECVKIGAQWVHLRTCQECGGTHCCDSSPNLIYPRGFAPRTPRHAHSRGPHAPLRSRGSLRFARSHVTREFRRLNTHDYSLAE